MQYYICNDPDPLDIPWGANAKFYTNEAEALAAAKRFAEDDPGFPFYVHAFPESAVIFKAASVVTVETEYLNGNPVQS